jgi:hypothetical protein
VTDFQNLLRRLDACEEAREWAGKKSLAEVWSSCDRADWLLWLCGRMAGTEGWPTRQDIVLVACLCAETALPIFEKKYPDDDRPRKAIEAARAWALCRDDAKALRGAAYAAAGAAAYAPYAAASAPASAPYAAASAPASAAYAAASDPASAADFAAYAASAAYAAAAATAYAATAYAATYAAYAARAGPLSKMADIVRENLKVPFEIPEEHAGVK